MIKKQVLLQVNGDIETFRTLTPQYKSNQLGEYSVFVRIVSIRLAEYLVFCQTVIIWLTGYSVFGQIVFG